MIPLHLANISPLLLLLSSLASTIPPSLALASEIPDDRASAAVTAGHTDPDDPCSPADETADSQPAPAETISSPKTTRYKIYSQHHDVSATIFTTEGDICCDLFVDTQPLTVLNFRALTMGRPAWTDRDGLPHSEPYYDGLAFERQKDTFAVTAPRPTGFVIPDERDDIHQPVRGAIAMNQTFPGTASAQFILFDRDIPELNGMFAVFGQCGSPDVIHAITTKDASIQHIAVHDGLACANRQDPSL